MSAPAVRRTFCAWCQRQLAGPIGPPTCGDSHAICDGCAAKLEAQAS